MADLTIVFAGSPLAAVPSLQALAASRHQIVTVLTREDSPQGRKRERTETALARAAGELALPVFKANSLGGAVTDQLRLLQPDLGVIVAYGALVREPLLSVPRLGWINLHFSLLPRWRGAAPVQRALIAGDEITGASVLQLVPELDAGPLFGQVAQPVSANENASDLLESLSLSGAQLLLRVVDGLADGTVRAREQTGDVTVAPKLTLEDGRISWREHATTVVNLIRGVTPEPGAFTLIDGQRIKILDAVIARDTAQLAPGSLTATGRVLVGTVSEPVELLRVQPAGRTSMAAADWRRGRAADAIMVME